VKANRSWLPDAQEQSGRGLRIVQELAEGLGITPSPNGKLVWFSLPLRPPRHARRAHLLGERASSESNPLSASRDHPPSKAIRRADFRAARRHISGLLAYRRVALLQPVS